MPPAWPAAEQVLAERFARGEIDAEEYWHRLDVLRGSGGSPGAGPPAMPSDQPPPPFPPPPSGPPSRPSPPPPAGSGRHDGAPPRDRVTGHRRWSGPVTARPVTARPCDCSTL
ncbi:SHOCT domain-containing protein [Kitasatospora purpeofusca]|nr:SHOCT domain-containing protein [Kitasatospora purpeofusca]MDY0814474.1 SHOCT domain-containing protein [Kitasatospora purpeofusca]